MVEEETSWPIFIYRYVEDTDEYADYFYTDKPQEVRKQFLGMLAESVGKRAHGHGIGRHDSEEIQKIGCDDVQAISDFLGEKPFMMGDKPTLVVYVPIGYPMRKYIQEKCPNIISLCDRLKVTYWTNWDEHKL